MTPRKAPYRGFKRTSQLLQERIRRASESRGFVQSRVLTHWAEIVGEDIAAIARPVEVSYGRQGFGATLTVLTTGAQAPMLEMQKEKLREKINAVYGYNAIARLRLTQTAATGFAEGQAQFDHGPAQPKRKNITPEIKAKAASAAAPVEDDGLRSALELLGKNILSKQKNDQQR